MNKRLIWSALLTGVVSTTTVAFLTVVLGAGWTVAVVAGVLTTIAVWLLQTGKSRHDVAYSLAGTAIIVMTVVTVLSLAAGYTTAVGALFLMTVSASSMLVLFASRPK